MLSRFEFGESIRSSPLNLSILSRPMNSFITETNTKKVNYIPYVESVVRARTELTDCKILLLGLVDAEHNKYIKAINERYQTQERISESLGRMDNLLDEKAKTIEQIKSESDFLRTPTAPFKMKEYLAELINICSHLVYYPVIQAVERYNNFFGTLDGKPIQKDKELFQYFLYVEIYNSSKSLGPITRVAGQGRTKSVFPNYQNLPRVPMNVRTIEDESELPPEEDSQIEEYFIDDFQDETVQEEENQD